MTALPAAGYGSNSARTQGEMKTYFEDIVAFLRERGGAGAGWVDVASASTVDLGARTGRMINFTGTTGITSLGTTNPGDSILYLVKFAGILTVTHGANLQCPGGANITTAAGDVFAIVWEGSNVWRVVAVFRANGRAVQSRVAQVVSTVTGAVATGTTTIPADDTIPQITEGNEYMTRSITPTNASSILKIEVTIVLANSAATTMIAALFQDSTANALAAVPSKPPAGGDMITISFTHYMTAGTTSSTTFRVRAGGAAAGTTTFNGFGGNRIFGGVMSSSIVITEYLP